MMPRKSKRNKVLDEMEQMKVEISITQLLRHLDDSENGDSSSEGMLNEIADLVIDGACDLVSMHQYLPHQPSWMG